MTRPARYLVLAAVVAGAAGALALLLSFRTPCGGLLRRYAATYDALKGCRVDGDCIIDPMPAGGPGMCERARAAGSDRSALDGIERAWREAGCPAPGLPCPSTGAALCVAGQCSASSGPERVGSGGAGDRSSIPGR